MLRNLIIIAFLLFSSAGLSAAEDTNPPADMPPQGHWFGRGGGPGPGPGMGMGKHGGKHGRGGGPCYSGSRADNYGACKPVVTADDAIKRLKESSSEEVVIDRLEERPWFFKADILDKDGKLLDKVIIHKKSGRIRSIL